MKTRILLVEDDERLADLTAEYLRKTDFEVAIEPRGDTAEERILKEDPELVVLDVMLPGMSGLDACRQLRIEGDRVPVILLTARVEEVDRVLGLEMGADDYLGKPFSARELLARIHAVLRRSTSLPGTPLMQLPEVLIGEQRFEPAARCLRHRGTGVQRMLSGIEYALLAELVARPGLPMSRERLAAVSHERGVSVQLRTIDVAMMRLRKLVEPDPTEPRFLQTVRGHGYMFVPGPA